jgi:hypothetical protein
MFETLCTSGKVHNIFPLIMQFDHSKTSHLFEGTASKGTTIMSFQGFADRGSTVGLF